jgi:hypothetical protein
MKFASPKALKRLFRAASKRGRDERLIARSGLFDEPWYLTNNPDAAHFPGGALRHFLLRGGKELRDPNPYFDAAWYCQNHPDLDWRQSNPLVHYLEHGWADGARPSPNFDPAWYRTSYPDVANAGIEPLSHFLLLGKAEGRLPQASNRFHSVDEAALLRLKAPSLRETMALFACHAPGGRIKPHVRPLLEALAGQGVATTLIVAADEIQSVDWRGLFGAVDGLYVRQNQGYDFAAWARIARDLDISHTSCLGLVNDSIIGPLNAGSFSVVFDRIRASRAHLVGLTDSVQITHHVQSYFLIAKGEGVPALRDYLAGVKAYDRKEEVIINYELPLLRRFREANLTVEALFPPSTDRDETLERWRELIQRGFPFVKARALRLPGAEDWRNVLEAQGYDASIAERTLAIIEQNDARPPQSPTPQA